jgi:Tfp pilus assembly protein PilF
VIQWLLKPLGAIRSHPGRTLLVLALIGLVGVGAVFTGRQLWANHHFRAAQECLKEQDLLGAHDHLELCLEVWPTDGEVLWQAARCARRMGRYDEAEYYLNRLVDAGWPEHIVQVERYIIEAQRGYFPSVERQLRAIVEETKDNPEVVQILEVLSKHYLSARDPFRALPYLNMWVKRDPENTTPLLWRAWLWASSSNLEDAESNLRQALRVNPHDRDARVGLGEILIKMRRPKQALQQFLYVKDLPGAMERPRVLIGLAQCRIELGERDAARKILDRLLAVDPKNVEAMRYHAKIARRPADVEKWLRRALRTDPNDLQANYALYLFLNGYPDRKSEAQKYLAKFKRLDNALKRMDEVINHELPGAKSRTPALEYEVGTLNLTLGRYEEAKIWLDRAWQHGRRDRLLFRAMAECCAALGQKDNATYYRDLAARAPAPRPDAPGSAAAADRSRRREKRP